ncbi:MAG: tRNA pseudouridine(55) synthase TruB [Lachnospiraceae bacterium]|nr:tRNA pseudouridine(55) synthase TruB [Lachnospiraceae bacterium]
MDGALVVYKERGMTSHDVVARLRRILHQKKIGHTGTLDPEAEGVLPVLIGRATRLSERMGGGRKVYRAELLLGVATDTEDAGGTLLKRADPPSDEEAVAACIRSFAGPYEQIPPMYSAKKINGQKLVDLARQGKEIERRPVHTEIYAIEILAMDLPHVYLRVSCSRGTYIRSLCRDIGDKLGCGGCMGSLLREETGGFTLASALTLAQIEALALAGFLDDRLISLEELLRPYPAFTVRKERSLSARCGNPLPADALEEDSRSAMPGPAVLREAGGELVGLYRYDEGKARWTADIMLNMPPEPQRKAVPAPSVVTIGKFDGFHLGHRAILAEMRRIAAEKGLRCIVFSFSDSPQAVMEGRTLRMLMTPAEKRRTAALMGADMLTEFPFTEKIRRITAEEFLEEILIGRLGMREIVAGPDCRFGFERRGDIGFLAGQAERLGFGVTVVPRAEAAGEPVSSSRIRELLSEGRADTAALMLGGPFSVEGPVVMGRQLGRKLGVPTINQLFPAGKLIPRRGVYAARVTIGGGSYYGMANAGVRPTLGGVRAPGLETHLFGFDREVYGETACTQLLRFLRPEKQFAREEELREQIQLDAIEVKKYLAENGFLQ